MSYFLPKIRFKKTLLCPVYELAKKITFTKYISKTTNHIDNYFVSAGSMPTVINFINCDDESEQQKISLTSAAITFFLM